MAEYILLICEDETKLAEASPEVWAEVMQAHNRFAQQVPAAGGKILGGRGLQPSNTATAIRGGVVTDGPFIETKETVGGYYVVEARDHDHAVELAKLCPARFGGVELRPVMDTSGM